MQVLLSSAMKLRFRAKKILQESVELGELALYGANDGSPRRRQVVPPFTVSI
jgi:hypothetical protein